MIETLEQTFQDIVPPDADFCSLRFVDERTEHICVRQDILQPVVNRDDFGAIKSHLESPNYVGGEISQQDIIMGANAMGGLGMNAMSGMNGMNAMSGMNGMNVMNGMNGINGMNGMNGMHAVNGGRNGGSAGFSPVSSVARRCVMLPGVARIAARASTAPCRRMCGHCPCATGARCIPTRCT